MGDDSFNNPFAQARKELIKQVKEDRRKKTPDPGRGSSTSGSPDRCAKGSVSGAVSDSSGPAGIASDASKQVSGKASDDERLFRQYMAGVKPIDRSNYVPTSGRRPRRRSSHARGAERAAALYDFIQGAGHFDIEHLDEYVTGLAPGVDQHLLGRLKRGEFAVQAHIDLHGMYADEARDALVAFFERARKSGKRCVLVVHGRGLHSPEGTSTLKELLMNMLTHGPLSKHVLAFATARPVDGGPGAMYVLLRRNRSPFR